MVSWLAAARMRCMSGGCGSGLVSCLWCRSAELPGAGGESGGRLNRLNGCTFSWHSSILCASSSLHRRILRCEPASSWDGANGVSLQCALGCRLPPACWAVRSQQVAVAVLLGSVFSVSWKSRLPGARSCTPVAVENPYMLVVRSAACMPASGGHTQFCSV